VNYSERRAADNPVMRLGVGQPERRRPMRNKHPREHTHRTLQHVRPGPLQRRSGHRRLHRVPDHGFGGCGTFRYLLTQQRPSWFFFSSETSPFPPQQNTVMSTKIT